MKIDHNKYPIIIGSTYVNDEYQIGILDSCEMFNSLNNAEIRIDMQYRGIFYILNYDTFCMYWKLLK